jgi:hypothetical protein
MEENELRSSQGQPISPFYSVFIFAAFCFCVLRTYPLHMLLIMRLLASTVSEGRICVCTLFILFALILGLGGILMRDIGISPDGWGKQYSNLFPNRLFTFLYAPDDCISFVSSKNS